MARVGPDSHLCRHPIRRGRWPGVCHNRVRNDSGYRYCHEHRTGWREFLAQLGGGEFTRRYNRRPAHNSIGDAGKWLSAGRLPAPRSEGTPRTRCRVLASDEPTAGPTPNRHRADQPSPWQIDIAVRETRSIADAEWRRTATRRVKAVLGPPLHGQVLTAVGVCDDLAAIADILSATKARAEREVGRAIAALWPSLKQPRIAGPVAEQLARRLLDPATSQMAVLVHALRACGVLVCIVGGRDLARCRCLWPLARHEIEQQIKNHVGLVVRHGLDRLEPTTG